MQHVSRHEVGIVFNSFPDVGWFHHVVADPRQVIEKIQSDFALVRVRPNNRRVIGFGLQVASDYSKLVQVLCDFHV
jgi:DNA polymerase III delta prime subunit